MSDDLLEGKVSLLSFREEKEKVQDWYKSKLHELRKTRKILLKSYRQAQHLIGEPSSLRNDKSTTMMKCLSDKYLLKTTLKQKQGNLSDESSQNSLSIAQPALKIKNQRTKCEEREDVEEELKSPKIRRREADGDTMDGHIKSPQFKISQHDQKPIPKPSLSTVGPLPSMLRQTSLDIEADYHFQEIERAIDEDEG